MDLFDDEMIELQPSLTLIKGMATAQASQFWQSVMTISRQSPFRKMQTPGGQWMSAEITNCGTVGWVSDRQGYRYVNRDPLTDQPWPLMPVTLYEFACEAASRAGFEGFSPDICLINRYRIASKMGLHQDRDERDFAQPIVSVSLGLSANFLFGGERRNSSTQSILLEHGDVLVWGGPLRKYFHGISKIYPGDDPLTGPYRVNLTFRRAL
ncbi:alpha-ketoglutarate-dependent dioxygenase AlkB [Methylophaga lonarensis MPL]|uniref:Alpha-ketoglutarate-dependent dioxygenase AlkB n=2 Tax=Methylophaga lonarensis TaxID=999151 RepID=M7P045_9GAMM|nr:alpha-ketoglutarate-dependent dioxygenase AlkB [Methylophaga lonarensis MPL]